MTTCTHALLIRCSVHGCYRHGAPNGMGCGPRLARGVPRQRFPVFLCDWCTGRRGSWADRREVAGLSVGQAAKLLGVQRATLEAIEAGSLDAGPLARQMARIYTGEAIG